MSDKPFPMYALLVGIDQYAHPSIPDLAGCANDVNAVEQLLQDKFNVPQENIKKLLDSQATYKAIKEAFRTHLINNAKAWVEAGKPEPVPAFLFHYSGHGSQAIDETGQEPDGLDETIVPHDSRTADTYDLKDWELGKLIDELADPFDENQANVTIIMDCCHSGSGTRDINPTLVRTRRCDPDKRPQPNRRPIEGAAKTRSISSTPSGWELGTKYVLLAGCRDREESNEHLATPEGKALAPQQHGAMTYFMLQELSRMSPNRPLTYRDLHERVRYQVNSRYALQMPQCEGAKDRAIFGGLKPVEDVLLSVIEKSDYIWVSGGAAHGLTEGSQLHVYPPGTTSLKEAGTPLTTLYVNEVGAVKSGCTVESGQPEVELHSKVAIAHIDYSQMQQRVVLDIEDEGIRQEVEQMLAEETLKPYINLLPTPTEEDKAGAKAADLIVKQVGDNLELQDGTGKPLVAAFPPGKRQELPHDLKHIARYHNALKLTNPLGELAGAIQVEFKKLAIEAGQIKAVDLPRNAEGEIELLQGDRIVITLTNKADQPLYVAVFNFSHDWSVNQLYPRITGAHEALAPGVSISLGLSAKRSEQLMPGLAPGVSEAREFLKVIATVEETDFELLQMNPLKVAGTTRSIAKAGKRSALTALLEQAASGSETRAIHTPPATAEDEWSTTDLQFRILRPIDDKEVSQPVQGGKRATLPGFALEVEPPAGFNGQVRVLTARQNTRAANGDVTELAPPPGLAPFKKMFEPVQVQARGSRDALGTGGAVIELEADEAARSKVSADTPLKLHLPEGMVGQDEAMIALAYDGSLFYPVGRPGDEMSTVNVEWLPEVAPPEGEGARTRNLGRTVKLYLFKMAGWEEPSLGLHKVSFIPAGEIEQNPLKDNERGYDLEEGQARYRKLRAGELKAGQRVALFVHGFTSETRWMVAGPMRFLEANGIGYDHYLAFDYETFNTHVSDNGKLLAEALQEAGFGPDDELKLDVFAHSMGTMITRSMVEQHGGEAFVDRCFLAGPPNSGSRLAELKRLVPWVGTLLLNQAGPTPPAMIASWALKKITDDAIGGDDLRPSSEFIKDLNAIKREAKVPYYILAGRNELSTEAEGAWNRLFRALSRGTDVALDTFFGDQHDLVINVQSMVNVRNGKYPEGLLHTHVLQCNHFQYFVGEGQEKLLGWLKDSA